MVNKKFSKNVVPLILYKSINNSTLQQLNIKIQRKQFT